MEQQSQDTFHLGLVVAGAVSAGAYSAGALYYLLQNLKEWEEKKQENKDILAGKKEGEIDPRVPMHNVVLEVIGGASAGSMVAAIVGLVYDLDLDEVDYNAKEWLQTKDGNPLNNPFYDLWVHMLDNDKDNALSIGSFFDKVSRKKDEPINSFLQTRLIDTLSEKLFEVNKAHPLEKRKKPLYVSENLEIVFTLTNLRGVDVSVYFNANDRKSSNDVKPAHNMRVHKLLAYYKINDPANRRLEDCVKEYIFAAIASGVFPATYAPQIPAFKVDSVAPLIKKLLSDRTSDIKPFFIKKAGEVFPKSMLYLNRSLESNVKEYILSAVASGAFPIAFSSKVLNFKVEYVNQLIEDIFSDGKLSIRPRFIDKDHYEFNAIDGGTLNNEPIGEVINALDRKKVDKRYTSLILIDPFPNFEEEEKLFEPIEGLKKIIASIIGSIRSQAMVKGPKYLKEFEEARGRFGMIYPSRRDKDGNKIEKNHLAAAPIGGFSGFLSPDFRAHDFKLGMKNCQSFIRRYLFITKFEAEMYSGYKNWSDTVEDEGNEQYRTFRYIDRDGTVKYPIIPDIALINGNADKAFKKNTAEKPDEEQINECNANIETNQFAVLDFPKIDKATLSQLKKPLKSVVTTTLMSLISAKSTQAHVAKDKADKSSFIKQNNRQVRWGLYAVIIILIAVLGVLYFLISKPFVFWLIVMFGILLVIGVVQFALKAATNGVLNFMFKELFNNDLIRSSQTRS